MYIIIVEDNSIIANQLKKAFSGEHKVDIIQNPEEAQERLEYIDYDVCCFDIDLNNEHYDGIDLCRFAREKNPNTIIVMFTGHGITSSLTTRMLEAGADSFVEKNSTSVELLKKTITLLQKKEKEETKEARKQLTAPIFGKIQIDQDMRTITVDGEQRAIKPMPLKIFQKLYYQPNKFIHSSTLVRAVKDPLSNTGISIKVHISELRKTIHPYGDHLRNSWGGWYGFFTEDSH